MDFRDFFPSIKFQDFKSLLQDVGISEEFKFVDEDFHLIKNVCFTKYNSGLAIGAPCSPVISNTIMFEFDNELESKIKALNPDSIFTRYADDIVFSTNKEGECEEFESIIKDLIEVIDRPTLQIHEGKTYYMSRGTKKMITGLIVTPDGKISIGRDQKRYVKKLVFDFSKNQIADEDLRYLRGYLAYILDVEPRFYNSLVQKYSAEILDSIRETAFN